MNRFCRIPKALARVKSAARQRGSGGALLLSVVLSLAASGGAVQAQSGNVVVLPTGFSSATPSFIGQSVRFIASRNATPPPAGARNLCASHPWACATSGNRAPLTLEQLQTVSATNRRINRTVRQISDRAQYGVEDRWALPTVRGGDCEDFARLKKLELMRAGIAPERLLIATVLDRRLRAHAVLVLRADFGDFVLDNLTAEIKPWQATGYTFLKIQNPQAKQGWVGVLTGGILTS